MPATIRNHLMAAVVTVFSAAQAQATGVVPGASFSVTFDPMDAAGEITASGAQLGGGDCGYFAATLSCDAQAQDAFDFVFGFNWDDADSFTLALTDPNFSSGPLKLMVSASVVLPSGVSIDSVTAAPSADLLGFLNGPDNPTSPIFALDLPTISIVNSAPGAATIELDFASLNALWWADGGYFLGFDVTFDGGSDPAVVPLPATAGLLAAALAGLAAWRRRA